MAIAGPYEFLQYLASEADRKEAERLGIPIRRFMHNDGSVSIMGRDTDGDRVTVANIPSQTPFKRGTGHAHICAERDALAERITALLNADDARKDAGK